jgi:hypothetical protein
MFRFPLPIFIPPIAPKSPSSTIWGWNNRLMVAAVPRGLSLTPLRIIKEKKLRVRYESGNSATVHPERTETARDRHHSTPTGAESSHKLPVS